MIPGGKKPYNHSISLNFQDKLYLDYKKLKILNNFLMDYTLAVDKLIVHIRLHPMEVMF